MDEQGLLREIERVLSDQIGEPVRVEEKSVRGGGCINNAARIDTTAGPWFVKWNVRPLPDMFLREAEGLALLRAVGVIPVPEPIAASNGGDDFPPYLITTCVRTTARAADFWQTFGTRFARLHREGTAERFGLDHDNYLGATPQPNGWMDNWIEFFRERRLGFQLRLARENGFVGELQERGEKLLSQLPKLLDAPPEPPSLLHGDLWSGNFMIGEDGEAVLIDPAVYYGHREADIAMTQLFGGFAPEFFAAYEKEWPLPPGSERRLEIYKFYHLLNHLNLFGESYLAQCMGVLRRVG